MPKKTRSQEARAKLRHAEALISSLTHDRASLLRACRERDQSTLHLRNENAAAALANQTLRGQLAKVEEQLAVANRRLADAADRAANRAKDDFEQRAAEREIFVKVLAKLVS